MALTKISSNLVADDAIVTGKIADGGVATADLAANAVTTAKIAQNNVTAHHIADGSVTTTQLGADSVTNAKIADDAISEEHLDKTIISDLTEVTAVNGDFLMIGDTSDSNNLKKVPVSSLPGSSALPLAGGTLTGTLTSNSLIKTTGDLEVASSQPRILLDRGDGSYAWNIYNGDGTGNFPISTFNIANNAGTSVVTIDTNGNVGIGDTGPDYLLDMRGTIGDQAPLQRWTVTGTPSAGFNWVTEAMSTNLGQDKRIVHAFGKERSNGNSGTMSFVPRASSGDNAIAFGIFGNNDILNITYNGHVGIGTTTPARKLAVKSGGANATQISLIDNDSTNEVFAVGQQSDGDGFVTINQDDGTTGVLFDASGDSYINGGSLHIGSTDSIASSAEKFSVYNASTGHTKLVNNSDSYSTLYIHNESTTADTFQPFITFQKGGGNRGNIGVRHTDSVLGIQGQGGISFRTPSTSVQSSTERLNIGSDGFVKLGKGNGIGALHNTGQNVANSFVNFFDFSDLAPGSGQERGMYLVSMSRNGGSVGTRILAFIGVSTNSTVYVYEILASAGSMSLQSNGSSLQVKTGSTSNQSIQGTAIPVAIDHTT